MAGNTTPGGRARCARSHRIIEPRAAPQSGTARLVQQRLAQGPEYDATLVEVCTAEGTRIGALTRTKRSSPPQCAQRMG